MTIQRVAEAHQIETLANAIALQAEAIRTGQTHGADIHAVAKLLQGNVSTLVAWTKPLDVNLSPPITLE